MSPSQASSIRADAAAAADVAADRPRRALTVCGGTSAGARHENQDTFVIADLESGEISRPCIKTDVWIARPGVLMLVCDGMGGAVAGDVASRLAAMAIKSELEGEGNNVGQAPTHSLKRAVIEANDAILAEVRAHPDERGMGTTCTAAVISPDCLAIAHVGDTRAYLLRDGSLRVLTRDQTLAAELVANGVLEPDQITRSPYRHVLVQALGLRPDIDPAITDVTLRERDRILLCSDGLHGSVPEESIAAIMSGTPDVADVARALIGAALAANAPDDVTVVVGDCGPLIRGKPAPPAT